MHGIGNVKQVHHCTLPHEEDIIVRYIESGWFVYCRRAIKSWLLASPNHPHCREALRSLAAVRQERARHLRHYYYMIHPFSLGRMYWQFFMIFVLCCALTIIPINYAADLSMWGLRFTKIAFDTLCCVDIVFSFFTGYYNRVTNEIVLSQRRVARRYVFGYFLVDLLSSIPIHFIATTVLGYSENLPFLETIIYIKVLRLITIMKYLDVLKDRMRLGTFKFKIFKMLLFGSITLLWCSSSYYVLTKNLQNYMSSTLYVEGNLVDGLIHGCFKSAYVLLLVGHSDTPAYNMVHKLLQTIGLQIGFVLKLYFLAQVVHMLYKYNSSGSKYQQHMRQLNEYVRYKGLPEWMKRRIYKYCDFKYQKHFVKESEIMTILTPQLRQEIMLQECHDFLEKVEFFQGLPTSVLIRVVSKLKTVIALPNDVIIRAGMEGDAMYFISYGTVAVYTNKGKEICHLGDGAHFGEIALVMEERRVASVVAVDSCELLELSRTDFLDSIQSYPEYLSRLKKMAMDRMHTMRDTSFPQRRTSNA